MPSQPDSISRPWRRYLRSSVRRLIVLVLLIGAGLGWIVREARIQRDAVAAILKSGGRVHYDWEWRDSNEIPGAKPWAPQWLVDRIGVDYFGHVTLVRLPPEASDSVVAQVGRLSRLEYLSLWSPGDAGLDHLTGLTKLTYLGLYGSRVTDASLAKLSAFADLLYLDLRVTQVTDAGLVHLKRLTKLKAIGLESTRVTQAGMKELKRSLPSLKL
jgi:hypothetical protein